MIESVEQQRGDRRIRRIEAGEEAALGRVLEKFKHYDGADPAPFLDDPSRLLYVADDDEELLGWAYGYELIRPEGRKAVLLYEIDVVPEAQGTGIGRELVEAMLRQAQKRGAIEMWTLTDEDNDGTKEFYAALGAEAKSQVMYTWDLGDTGR